MRKLILINGVITIVGVLLDIYGIFDLTLGPAVLGVVDCFTFILMNEGIKSAFSQALAMSEVTFGDWFAEMKRGEPRVMVTITGHSLFNQVIRNAKKVG
ncbi:MAG: hypothetical protein NWE89_02265 [Candidatus Bathyarchaeota archaeon]|nr:hypothetical protein [Candidatus Bathyarchaeota archaeon]